MNFSRINSPIVRLHWAGWQSDTLTLQRAGWELAVDEDMARYAFRIAMRHAELRLHAVSQSIDHRMLDQQRRSFQYTGMPEMDVAIQHMASDIQTIRLHGLDLNAFHPIDAEPSFCSDSPQSMKELNIFRRISVPDHQIVIPQQTVPQLLEQILKLQDPKQAEIREKRRKELRRFMRESVNMDAGKLQEHVAAEIVVGSF